MNIQDNSRYHEVHARSLRDPEGFWGEAAREIARLEAKARPVRIEKRLEQPQERAPAFHCGAHPMHHDSVRFGLRLVRGLCQHGARDRDQGWSDRLMRVEFRLRIRGLHVRCDCHAP